MSAPVLTIEHVNRVLTVRQTLSTVDRPAGFLIKGVEARSQRYESSTANMYGVSKEDLEAALLQLGYVPLSAVARLTEETGLIHQWKMLNEQAKNLDLNIVVCPDGFILVSPPIKAGEVGRKQIGTYPSLFELRAGISDWLKAERQAGRKI